METRIVKRDGKREAFSFEKIKSAICKAFLSVGSFATDEILTTVLSRVHQIVYALSAKACRGS